MRIGLIIVLLATAANLFSQRTDTSKIVVADDRFVITYEVTEKDVIFVMEDLRAREIGGKTSEKMPYSYFGLSVDVDRDGRIDSRKDVGYELMKNNISICTQYLINAGASTGCGQFVSGAVYEKSSRRTDNAPFAHIVHRYIIPRFEIMSPDQDAINVVFHCVSEGDRFWAPSTFYPALDPSVIGPRSFSETIAITL